MGDISISTDWHHSPHQYIHIRISIGNILATQRRMGENAFHKVFQERCVSPTRHQILPSPLRGSGQDTVNSPLKLCEMHIILRHGKGGILPNEAIHNISSLTCMCMAIV